MKKHCAVIALLILAAAVFAQEGSGRGIRGTPEREPVSVSGTLVLSRGFIALKSGETLYYTPGLQRLAGFIGGLEENAAVTLEAYVRRFGRGEDARNVLWVTKLELNGRTYELGRGFLARGPAFQGSVTGGNFRRMNGYGRNLSRGNCPFCDGFGRGETDRRGYGNREGRKRF